MSFLIFLEHADGRLGESALEALTAGRELAAILDEPLRALLIIGPADPADSAVSDVGLTSLVAEAGRFGAEVVYLIEHRLLASYRPDAWATGVLQVADFVDADVIVASGTERGNEVLTHVAARTGEPFVANALDVDAGEPWLITRLRGPGSSLEDVELHAAERRLVSFAPHGVAASPRAEPVEPMVATFEPDLDERVRTGAAAEPRS